jgi:hypothetical protein
MPWSRLAYLYVTVIAVVTGQFLMHVPFEVSENLGNLLQLRATPSAWHMAVTLFGGDGGINGFLRPMSWVTSKLVFDLSGGHYFIVYRSLTIALVLLLMVLFVRLLKVSSGATLAVAMVSVAALIGLHTFYQTVRETELNIKLIIPVLCFGAVSLSAARPSWWKDALALLLMVYAIFANELGILVWVSLAAAYLVGFRGVSRLAVVSSTVVLGLYFYLRFAFWDVGAPGLSERSSGFGFEILDPPELMARFGDNPYPFYAYNVMASALSVLFSEPSSGAFSFTRALLSLDVTVLDSLSVATSVLTTAVMIWFITKRWRLWVKRDFAYEDRLFLVFVAVWAGNAVISFPYVKDISLSTGGAFYALGAFVALHFLVSNVSRRLVTALGAATLCGLLAFVSLGWSVRAALFFSDMRQAVPAAQSDWREVYSWLDEQGMTLQDGERALVEQLRTEMLDMKAPTLAPLDLVR